MKGKCVFIQTRIKSVSEERHSPLVSLRKIARKCSTSIWCRWN